MILFDWAGHVPALILITMGLISLLTGKGFFGDSGEIAPNVTSVGSRDLLNALSDKMFGTTYGQQALMDKQYQMNKDLQQAERDWQEKMMSKMNEYNSPANQMKLLAAAGLNPALMYGQMADIGSQNPPASGAASVGLASPQYGAVDPYIAATIDNIKADTEKKRSEVPVNQQMIENLKKEVEQMDANITNLRTSSLAKYQEFENLLQTWNFMQETWANRADLIGADAAKARLEVRTFMQSFNKQMEQIDATIRNLDSATSLNYAQRDQLREVLNLLKPQLAMLTKQAELIEKYGDAKEVVGMVTDVLNSINGTLGAIAQFFKIPVGK